MGRKSREKRERRAQDAREVGSRAGARSSEGQALVEEGDGLMGGLSNGRAYSLVRRDDLPRRPGQPALWRRTWLAP